VSDLDPELFDLFARQLPANARDVDRRVELVVGRIGPLRKHRERMRVSVSIDRDDAIIPVLRRDEIDLDIQLR